MCTSPAFARPGKKSGGLTGACANVANVRALARAHKRRGAPRSACAASAEDADSRMAAGAGSGAGRWTSRRAEARACRSAVLLVHTTSSLAANGRRRDVRQPRARYVAFAPTLRAIELSSHAFRGVPCPACALRCPRAVPCAAPALRPPPPILANIAAPATFQLAARSRTQRIHCLAACVDSVPVVPGRAETSSRPAATCVRRVRAHWSLVPFGDALASSIEPVSPVFYSFVSLFPLLSRFLPICLPFLALLCLRVRSLCLS